MQPKEHVVFIYPGLGDGTLLVDFAVRNWHHYGLIPIVKSVGWRNEEPFQHILNRLSALVDEQINMGRMVSLIGTSAGGSAALNVFVENLEGIHRVVTVCSRLRTGPVVGLRSFEKMTRTSNAFAQSVQLLEYLEPSLLLRERQQVMTVKALLGDEMVPASTSTLQGARNISIPTAEHMLSISAALTVFSGRLIKFLTE